MKILLDLVLVKCELMKLASYKTKSANKLLKSDCGKLSPFVQKDAQKPPIHRNRLARRYVSSNTMEQANAH